VPFAPIVGHARTLELLRRAVSRGSIPQSLLFAGPEGVGKHATAIALAQAINCPQRTEGDGCGTCKTCRRIAAGTFSDVVALDKGDRASIGIEPLREQVLNQIGYRPFEGRRRVFIIDPADDMTVQTQDALLKTLEEPPPSAVLILVTAYPDSLLATIRSRCRRVRFSPLPEEDVVRVLTRVSGLDPVEARHRAMLSGGSVSRALAADGREFVDDREAALGLLTALTERQMPARLKAAAGFALVDKKRRAREAASTRLALLASLLRDLLVLDVRGRDELANSDLADELARLVPAFPAGRLVPAFAAVRQAEASIDRNASPKIVADWLAVTL
jgi:DNA polymerase-3 subunit delta'